MFQLEHYQAKFLREHAQDAAAGFDQPMLSLAVAAVASDWGLSELADLHRNFHALHAAKGELVSCDGLHRAYVAPDSSWPHFAEMILADPHYDFVREARDKARKAGCSDKQTDLRTALAMQSQYDPSPRWFDEVAATIVFIYAHLDATK